MREYVWLIEAEIAPTRQSRAQVDIPLAVVDGVNTGSPTMYMVHADHLARPIRMTDASKAAVWEATYTPWGGPHVVTGAIAQNLRFPGQWFQLESGLHYNWHRHYDPSLGRYTQPDPLGFVDGPNMYAYADGQPHIYVDRDGRFVWLIPYIIGATAGAGIEILLNPCADTGDIVTAALLGARTGAGGKVLSSGSVKRFLANESGSLGGKKLFSDAEAKILQQLFGHGPKEARDFLTRVEHRQITNVSNSTRELLSRYRDRVISRNLQDRPVHRARLDAIRRLIGDSHDGCSTDKASVVGERC